MSMRQPEARMQRAATTSRGQGEKMKRVKGCFERGAPLFPSSPLPLLPLSLMFDICHLTWPEAAAELGRALAVELRVCRLYQHEEAVARGEREVGRVKDRVVRLGQTGQREHGENSEEPPAPDTQL